jgi:O-antigen/teichoic acid export membrane protein
MNKLFKNSTIYLLGAMITALGSVVSIPIMTRSLSIADYGSYDLLIKISEVVMLTIFLGCRPAYIRIFYDNKSDEWRQKVTATMIFFISITISAVLIIVYLFESFFLSEIIDLEQHGKAFNMMICWIAADVFFNISLTFLMLKERALFYVSLSTFKVAVYLSLLYFYVFQNEYGIYGAFLANFLITLPISTVALIYFAVWTRLKVSREVMKELLVFGLPILPTAVFSYMLLSMDRYFLVLYDHAEDLGLLSFASKVAFMAISLLFQPIGRVWAPYSFKRFEEESGPSSIGMFFEGIAVVAMAGFVFLILFSYIYIPLLADEKFYDAITILPIVAFSAVAYNLSNLSDVGILISKKTKYKPFIFVSAVAMSIVSNLFLTESYGMWGASTSTLLGMLSLFLLTRLVSDKCFFIPVNWKRLSVCLIISLVFVSAVFLEPYFSNRLIFYVYLIVMFFVYILSIFVFRVVRRDEVMMLISGVRGASKV